MGQVFIFFFFPSVSQSVLSYETTCLAEKTIAFTKNALFHVKHPPTRHHTKTQVQRKTESAHFVKRT